MKRKIEDYKNKLVAIFCSSIEEWNKINDLLGKKGLTRDYGDISAPDNTFVDCIHINGIGTASKKYYEQLIYVIYPASDFLEDDILKKCKKLYFPGTKFMTMATIPKLEIIKGIVRWSSLGNWIVDDNDFVIYEKYSNKFAEIVESKFEIGKWYKYNNKDNHYYKPSESKIIGSCVQTSEQIHTGVYKNTTNTWSSKDETKLADLSEIQEFLPEGHADKIKTEVIPEYVEYIDTKYKGKIVKVEEWTNHSFCCIRFENGQREQPFKDLVKLSTKKAYEAQNKPKQLNVKDLIKGEIYVFDISSIKNFISKFDHIDSYSYYDSCFIQKDEFDNDPGSANISGISNIRLATIEEKKWLNTCISQDKFIPKEDLHLYDDSGLLIKKEKSLEKQVEEGLNKSFQYPLIPKETFFTKTDKLIINGLLDRIGQPFKNNINSEDIYITPIIKKETKIQTITIESTTDLNLNLTKIKSKQIQTIKI